MRNLMDMGQQWEKYKDQPVRIVAFGSSNTELFWHSGGRHNWVDWLNINLREHVGRHVLVINQGICGETSENLIARLDRDVFSLAPEMAIITIGGNDAMQHFSYERYSANLKEICIQLLEKNIQPVLQTYYCPVYDDIFQEFKDIFESFVEANRTIAKELNIPLIDNYKFFKPFYENDKKKYKQLMRDGLHVNGYGNFIMGTIVSRSFELPDPIMPDDIKEVVEELLKNMEEHYKRWEQNHE